jgi:hypothetical protein
MNLGVMGTYPVRQEIAPLAIRWIHDQLERSALGLGFALGTRGAHHAFRLQSQRSAIETRPVRDSAAAGTQDFQIQSRTPANRT